MGRDSRRAGDPAFARAAGTRSDPSRPAEVARCHAWLERSLDLVQPDLVVALGLTAASAFLGRGVKLAEVRGRVHEVDGRRRRPEIICPNVSTPRCGLACPDF